MGDTLTIEQRIEKIEGALFANGLKRDMATLSETVKLLSRVVDGDARLGVRPLRETVAELDQAYTRAKWVVATLAVSNVGGIVGIISLLVGSAK